MTLYDQSNLMAVREYTLDGYHCRDFLFRPSEHAWSLVLTSEHPDEPTRRMEIDELQAHRWMREVPEQIAYRRAA